MKKSLMMTAVAVTMMWALVGVSGVATAGTTDKVLRDLRGVMDTARSEGGACRKTALGSIKAARNEVEEALDKDTSPGQIKKVRQSVRAALDAAEGSCSPAVRKPLRKMIFDLGSALDRAEGGSGAMVGSGECWDPRDQGCSYTRDGHSPMGKEEWQTFLRGVQREQSNPFDMESAVKRGIEGRYMTSRQLGRLLDEFRPSDLTMLDIVKICAPRVVNPQRDREVVKRFSNSLIVRDVKAVMKAQERGEP